MQRPDHSLCVTSSEAAFSLHLMTSVVFHLIEAPSHESVPVVVSEGEPGEGRRLCETCTASYTRCDDSYSVVI